MAMFQLFAFEVASVSDLILLLRLFSCSLLCICVAVQDYRDAQTWRRRQRTEAELHRVGKTCRGCTPMKLISILVGILNKGNITLENRCMFYQIELN
jgi:hypothetical protein